MLTFDTDLTLEEITVFDPLARCTPYCSGVPVLPTKTTQTSGRMWWKWKIEKQVQSDSCVVEIGNDSRFFPYNSGWFIAQPGDVLEIWCQLRGFSGR